MFAHIVPHFHAAGAGIIFFLLILIAACALILAGDSKEKEK